MEMIKPDGAGSLAAVVKEVVAELAESEAISVKAAVAAILPQVPSGTTTAEIVSAIVSEATLRGLAVSFDHGDR